MYTLLQLEEKKYTAGIAQFWLGEFLLGKEYWVNM